MTMLRDKYLEFLNDDFPSFHNPTYATQKVKDKLSSHFQDKIKFKTTKSSDLVYSSTIDAGEAIEVAFEAATSETRLLKNAAMILRNHIVTSHKKSKELPWPPSASDLNNGSVEQPEELKQFLSILLTGKKKEKASAKSERLIQSITEDICSAATGGRWKMPKHLLLGMSLRHLTESAEVLTLIN